MPELPSLLVAVNQMRATSKWMLATLAAAAGSLLVGGSLSDVSKATSTGEVILTVGGALAASGAIGRSIFAVARVLSPSQPLDEDGNPVAPFEDPAVSKFVRGDRSLLGGLADDLSGLESANLEALRKLRAAQASGTGLEAAVLHAQATQSTVQYMRDLAIHEACRARYDSATKTLGWCTVVTVLGAIAFAFGVSA